MVRRHARQRPRGNPEAYLRDALGGGYKLDASYLCPQARMHLDPPDSSIEAIQDKAFERGIWNFEFRTTEIAPGLFLYVEAWNLECTGYIYELGGRCASERQIDLWQENTSDWLKRLGKDDVVTEFVGYDHPLVSKHAGRTFAIPYDVVLSSTAHGPVQGWSFVLWRD